MWHFTLNADNTVGEVVKQVTLDQALLKYNPDGTPALDEATGLQIVLVAVGQPVPLVYLYHPDFVVTLHEDPQEQAQPGYLYTNGVFSAPVPATPTAAQVLSERDRLLQLAAVRIAPLQDAVDIGDATPADTAALLAWKKYRVALNRIEQQSGFPAVVVWPVAP